MTKVLLLRADATSPNLGVRVLKEGTEALVRRALGADVTVHVQNFDGGDTGEKFNREAVSRDILRPSGPIKRVLRQYDLVIDVCGGDSFTDIYGMNRLALILYTQRASQKLGIPTVMGPQTIGPFENRFARRMAAFSLKKMALVLSRDRASEAEARALGRPADLSATDVVFALPVPQHRERRGVMLNVSGLLWKENRHVDAETYRRSVRELVDELLVRGLEVTLLAHVIDNPNADNDVPALRELADEYGDRVATAIPSSLADVREMVAGAELVIGSRMHACLNALSTGTPAIPWAYSRKFAPLLEDIGWTYLVDLRTDADPVAATRAILDSRPLPDLLVEADEVRASTDARLASVVKALATLGGSRA